MNLVSNQKAVIAPWIKVSATLYDVTVCQEMAAMAGQTVTIKSVHSDHYILEEVRNFWWTDDLLLPVTALTFPEDACCITGKKRSLVTVYAPEGKTYKMTKASAAQYAHQCDDCGKWFLRTNGAGNRHFDENDVCSVFCMECLEKKDVCPICGDLMAHPIFLDGERMCDSCARMNGIPCTGCGELHLATNMKSIEGDMYCKTCAENITYVECPACGKAMIKKAGREPLCRDCAPYYRGINGYHHGPRFRFYGEENKMMGMELEVDDGDCAEGESSAREVNRIMGYHTYCCHDGSLNSGFEIITHPHTAEGLLSLPWEEMCRYLTSNDWRGHDTSTAGMHIHISRKAFRNDDAVSRFILFFENNWEFCKSFSRRNNTKIRTWAAPYLAPTDADMTPGKYTKDQVDKAKNDCDRRHCVNLTNSNTIEVRLFRSSLNPNTIRATIEMVSLLVDQANALSDKEAETFTYRQWLKDASDNLKGYCASRRIPLVLESAA